MHIKIESKHAVDTWTAIHAADVADYIDVYENPDGSLLIRCENKKMSAKFERQLRAQRITFTNVR